MNTRRISTDQLIFHMADESPTPLPLKAATKAGRGPNWSDKEIAAVVKAGLHVNLDEVHGADNKKT